jgi:hypothetical protein
LKRSGVPLMDEATASVDYATDELISRTIRKCANCYANVGYSREFADRVGLFPTAEFSLSFGRQTILTIGYLRPLAEGGNDCIDSGVSRTVINYDKVGMIGRCRQHCPRLTTFSFSNALVLDKGHIVEFRSSPDPVAEGILDVL